MIPENPNRFQFVEVTTQGNLLQVQHVRSYPVRWIKPAKKRGDITGFSPKSRLRLLRMFASMDKTKIVAAKERVKFITLTYPSNMQNFAVSKRHLDTFIKRLIRRNDNLWCVWRMEQQERGAIHFHLIVGNMSYWDKDDMQAAWGEIIGEDDPFTRIEALRSYKGVMWYVSKYLAKCESTPEKTRPAASGGAESALGLSMCHISPQTENESNSTGRWWGVYGRAHCPFAKRIRRRIMFTLETMKAWTDEIDSPFANHEMGFTVFCENPYRWLSRANGLEGLVIDQLDQWKKSIKWLFEDERDAVLDNLLARMVVRKVRKSTHQRGCPC